MTDTYQAVYDAVRSKIGSCDISEVVRSAIREAFDISFSIEYVKSDLYQAIAEYKRPSAVYRPSLSMDGNQWCVLYGENLQEGVAGFGDTPEKAMQSFDLAWINEKAGMRV